MEIKFDSELSDISEVDLDEAGPIQPYQYGLRHNRIEQYSDNEDDGSDLVDEEDNILLRIIFIWYKLLNHVLALRASFNFRLAKALDQTTAMFY